jgi:hypothetical protein
MLQDDRSGGEGRRGPSRNVFGEPLVACSINPVTGFYRDGCCNTGLEDVGSHTICVVTTAEFLEFSKSRGNDLSTPLPNHGFAGLNPAIAGVYVRPVGGKHSKPVKRPAWCCAPLTRRL